MGMQFTYMQFLELKENERTQIVNLSKNKLTVDERVNFEFKAGTEEYVTCALEVKLMNSRFCKEEIFNMLSLEVNGKSNIVKEVYEDSNGNLSEKIKEYKFQSNEEYCHFELFVNENLFDFGYIYVDYQRYDKDKLNGFLNVSSFNNLLSDIEKEEIFIMFSDVVSYSIYEKINNKEKSQKEKELDKILTKWMQDLGLYDKNGKMID